MDWGWIFLVNLVSAAGLAGMHLTHNNVPWYLTAILCLNVVLLAVSSLMIDWKNTQRDEKIKQLEKELQELKKEKGARDIIDDMLNAPTVDAIPVVKCKDCSRKRYCEWYSIHGCDENNFCSWGRINETN